MQEFYENLKNKRIEKGIDLRKIAEKTKLSLQILSSIESGKLDQIPRGYRRIYLRRYIKEIGLDPDAVMKDYDLLVGNTDVEELKESENIQINVRKGKFANPFAREKMKIMYTVLIALSIVGLIAISIIGIKALFSSSPDFEVKEVTIPMDVKIDSALAEDNLEQPIITSQSAVGMTSNNKNVVEIFARKRCWIKQIIDKKDTLEYILPANKSKSFSFTDQVRFIIGRGDAVKIKVNDREFDNLAPPGSVIRRLIVDKFGIVTKVIAKPKPKVEKSDSTQKQNVKPGERSDHEMEQ